MGEVRVGLFKDLIFGTIGSKLLIGGIDDEISNCHSGIEDDLRSAQSTRAAISLLCMGCLPFCCWRPCTENVRCARCGCGLKKREKELLCYPQLGLRAVRRIPGLATFWYALSKFKGGKAEGALRVLLPEEDDLAMDGKSLRGI